MARAPRTTETVGSDPTHTRQTGTTRGAARSDATFAKIAGEVTDNAKSTRTGAKQSLTESDAKNFSLWQDPGLGFGDFIDIINPLQHVPIVATLYRNLTGDRIGIVPRVLGGALWGRIGGFVSGIVNAAVEWFTGKDIGDHIYSALWGKPEGVEAESAVARAGRLEPQIVAPSRSPGAETVVAPTDKEKTKASDREQQFSFPPGDGTVAPLSLLDGTAATLIARAFTSYRNDESHDEPYENRKRLRMTA
jgi:hypothetical protein